MSAFDVVIAGGGPAASVCAIELARRRRRVVLLEADLTPQSRAGESLSPTACEVLESVGVNLAEGRCVAKRGATFSWGRRGVFRVRYSGATAWQVRRAELDTALLKLAEESGVQVWRGNRVEQVRFAGQRAIGVRMRAADGSIRELDAAWVVDATGRQALLAHQLQLLDRRCSRSEDHLMWSCWQHGDRLPGDAAGDGLFVGGGRRAWWYLPVDERDQVVSVGVFAPGPAPEGALSDAYLKSVACSAPIARLLAEARHQGPVYAAPAGTHASRSLVGTGWLLVGDAAGFVDPILTPGVQLGVEYGKLAAAGIDAALYGDPSAAHALRRYERGLKRDLSTYRWLADNLYTAADAERTDDVSPAGDEREDRLTFLSVIAGVPPQRLTPLLGEYLAMRAAAVRYGGEPPVLDETEGFAFLTWLARGERTEAPGHVGVAAVLRPAPAVELADLSSDCRRSLLTAGGDEFLLTLELETLLRAASPAGTRAELEQRFAKAAGGTPDAATFERWLDLLLRYGVLECVPEPAPANAAGATRAVS